MYLIFAALYRQFDTIIFPEAKDKSNIFMRGLKRGWELMTGVGSSETDHPKFTVPDVSDIRNRCLDIYLQTPRNTILNGSYPEYFEIKEITENCFSLFQSCFLQLTEHRGRSHDWNIPEVKNVSLLHPFI